MLLLTKPPFPLSDGSSQFPGIMFVTDVTETFSVYNIDSTPQFVLTEDESATALILYITERA